MGNIMATPDLDLRQTADARKTIDDEIVNTSVLMYSLSNCYHCLSAKKLLHQEKIDYKSVELDKMDSLSRKDFATQLLAITSQRTVPQIWLCGKHIGGFNELANLHMKLELHGRVAECPEFYPANQQRSKGKAG